MSKKEGPGSALNLILSPSGTKIRGREIGLRDEWAYERTHNEPRNVFVLSDYRLGVVIDEIDRQHLSGVRRGR